MKKFINVHGNLIDKETIRGVRCCDYSVDDLINHVYKERIIIDTVTCNVYNPTILEFDDRSERDKMFTRIEKELGINQEFHKDQIVHFNNSEWQLICRSNFETEYGGVAVNPNVTYWAAEEIYTKKRLHISEDLFEPLQLSNQ